MMDLRKRLLLLIGVTIGVAAAVVLFILAERAGKIPGFKPAVPTPTESASAPSGPATPPAAVAPPPANPGNPTEMYVKQLAQLFVERFSSYSNQDGNQHIGDVMSLATPQMQSWLATRVQSRGGIYQGVTTRVVAVSIQKLTDAAATVHLDVQQISSSATSTARLYRSGRVQLLKINGEWKVDGVYWE